MLSIKEVHYEKIITDVGLIAFHRNHFVILAESAHAPPVCDRPFIGELLYVANLGLTI